jgi:hypothetical protein
MYWSARILGYSHKAATEQVMDFVEDVREREEEWHLDTWPSMYWSARTLGYSHEAAEQQVMDFVEDVRKEERDELRSPSRNMNQSQAVMKGQELR